MYYPEGMMALIGCFRLLSLSTSQIFKLYIFVFLILGTLSRVLHKAAGEVFLDIVVELPHIIVPAPIHSRGSTN